MKNKNKISAWSNVLSVILIAGVLQLISFFVYPIVYLFRGAIRKTHFVPLWIFLDDEGGDWGNPLENKCKLPLTNFLYKFISAYNWSVIRNPVWNIYSYTFFRPGDSLKTEITFTKGLLYSYERKYLIMGNAQPTIEQRNMMRMNRAKFYSFVKGDKSISTNEGEYLDLDQSYFGSTTYYFKQNNRWLVLKTFCKITYINDEKAHIREINIGALGLRIGIRNKWQSAEIE